MAIPWLVGIGSFIVLLYFQAQGIYAGDSGDLVAASYLGGVPHPSGYPLYTFLGWLITRVSLLSPAWQVGLLSSLSHAAVASAVSWFVYRVTRSGAASVFSALLLLGNYVFFLYGTIQEVYALANLLLVLWVMSMSLWRQTRKNAWLYAAGTLFGLGLSHHHVAFLLPVIAAGWFFIGRRVFAFPQVTRATMLKTAAAAAAGLLPHIYIWFAARGTSIINWDHATTPERFIRLFMLTDYGSFKGNVGFGELLSDRLLGIKALGEFLVNDFSGAGLVLTVLGMVSLYRSRRADFWLITLALVMFGPVLYFYAGFPLAGRFTLGTFEQFLLFSETFVALVAGIGFAYAVAGISALRSLRTHKLTPRLVRFAAAGAAVVLFLYPAVLFSLNAYRFRGFQRDETAQRLGKDILETVPPNSIVLLYGDTALFTAQYARYVLGQRPDVIVLQAGRVGSDEYTETMKRAFPSLRYPPSSGQAFVKEFIGLLTEDFTVYSNSPITLSGGSFWVPHGLLYQLTPEDRLPAVETLKERNEAVWARYQNPAEGILSRFNHLLLSDVRGPYAAARITYGKTLLKAGAPNDALKQFSAAAAYQSDTYQSDAHLYEGISLMALERCQEAVDAFAAARRQQVITDPHVVYSEAVAWRDCFKDEARAREYFSEYERLKRASEQSLEAL